MKKYLYIIQKNLNLRYNFKSTLIRYTIVFGGANNSKNGSSATASEKGIKSAKVLDK
ncbi:hypothetical protein acsn021_39450 [Anaerocolumna cellulosilytica]|uniref:Uncharacterized protein n=1 Tax=Anaerocolumna cellulosilytica TaxID=433286 RepID=A0A6S6R2K7_9FIRM|nr:hypothetical protein [Anaerocolumna cellulosilytica]MBB5196347.1 hypothetical protein [Anaerocolumna cellulosilytica]BCJ96376.1 hypothetical protein acsn021_39450 [Anaerocolumna cellulosilytica]